MVIAVNADRTLINRLNQLQGEVFVEINKMDSSTNAVVMIRDNPGFDLDTAVSAGCPVVVVAGVMDEKGKEIIQQSRNYMIPDACIIIKNGDRAETLDKTDLGRAPAGIGIRSVLAAVKNAVANNMVPDVLIWRETKTSENANKDNPKPFTTKEITKETVEKPPAETRELKTRIPRAYSEFVNLYDYILCLVLGKPAGAIVKDLAESLGAVHVECGVPKAHELYGDYENNYAYAYERDNSLMMPGGAKKAVVQAAMEDLSIDALELLYSKAKGIVHIASMDRIPAVKDWLDAGYRLNAVIADDPNVCKDILNNRAPIAANGQDAVRYLGGLM